MSASKDLSMKRTSESSRSHSSTAAADGAQSDEDTIEETSVLSKKPLSHATSVDDQIDKLIPGRLRDFGGEFSSSAFGVWSEREWVLRANGNRVHLDAVDFHGRQFQTYQWFTGQSEADIPTFCVFCPPLIPLQPPSSLHECRSLESTGTFAIAWTRNTATGEKEQHYIRVYDPEDSPIVGLCQDRRWVHNLQLPCRGNIVSMALAPGGSHLIAGGRHGLQLWNLSMEEEIWSVLGDMDCPGGIAQVDFSPDGRLFASVAPNSKMVRLWWRSESAAHGGFAFLLLPHGNQVQKFAWRPRSSSSSYGTAQSILTQTVAGTIRIWQESDHLEDFDFYTVCEINACPPSSFVSWIEYYADYEGLLWPPESSFRKPRAFGASQSGEEDQSSKKSKGYSSKRLWGPLDRGHGHAWFGEAAYDNLESRLGSFPSSSSMRDWIVSIDEDKVTIWTVEGLGEHARTSIRCEIWTQKHLRLALNARTGLAFCRFNVPVCHEGQSMPRCDELYADNVPSKLRLCCESSSGAMGIVSFGFGEPTTELASQMDAAQVKDDEGVDVQSSFFQPHLSNQITLLARSEEGEVITADKSGRVVWWSNENKVVRTIDVRDKVHFACFMDFNNVKSIVTINEEIGGACIHDFMRSTTLGLNLSVELGRIVGVCSVKSAFILVREHGILIKDLLQTNSELSTKVSMNVLAKFHSKAATAVCVSADMNSLWIGFEDGSLRKVDIGLKVGDPILQEEHLKLNGNGSENNSPSSKYGGPWKVRKIQAAGMWIARMMESSINGERLVVMSSLASVSLNNEFEEEDLAQRVRGLTGGNEEQKESTSVVDIALCEFGQSLVCGLAVLMSNGSVKIASRVKDRWVVIAQSQSMQKQQSSSLKWQSITWLDKGRLIALDDSSVLEFSGWTCPSSTNLPWTFSGGLNVTGWGSVDDQGRSRNGPSHIAKRVMLRRANTSSRMMLKDEDLSINESMGNIAWLCAQSQLSLPAHHPRSLLEDLRQGQLSRVEKVLKHVSKSAEEHSGGTNQALVVPPFDPGPSSSDFHLSRGKSGGKIGSNSMNSNQNQTAAALFGSSASSQGGGGQTAAALFATPSSSFLQNQTAANLFATSSSSLMMSTSEKPTLGDEENESAESEENWLESLESKLPTLKISGLSPSDHLALLSRVSLYRRLSDDKISGLDPAGSRFALAVETLRVNTRGMMASDSLRTCDVIWALHSDAQTSLMKNFLEHPNLTWDECRAIGAAFWVTNPEDVKSLTERLAKSHFIKYDRDPFRCLLFYCALNKPRICSALFKAAKNEKVAQLLAQDFTQERWKIAASKNGYALVERKRYEEAAGFFLLADKHSEAIRVLSRSLEDYQLALFVAKIIACVNPQEGPKVLEEFLTSIYMEVGRATKDPWLSSMIFTLLNKPQDAIRCFSPDFFETFNGEEEEVVSKADLERRRERFVWLRQVASRDKPKVCGFDPIAIAFIQHILSRPPLLYSKSDEFDRLLVSNRQRTILFYLSEGLPRLAEDLLSQESSEAYDKFKSQARLSAALPGMVSKGGSEVSSSEIIVAEHTKLLQATRELNLVRSFLGSLEANSEVLANAVEDVVEKKIGLAIKSLAIGGMASSRVSARRLACYSLCLNEQIPRLTSPAKELASIASYGGLVVSTMLLKQTNLVEAFFACGPFELGKQVRPVVATGGLRLSRDYVDYEETLRGRPSDTGSNWATSLARSVLRLAIFEDLLQQFSSACSTLTSSAAKNDDGFCSLLSSIGSLISRLRSDVHYLAGLPDFASSPFSTLVDPLRPYFSTTKAFEDLNEQALWTRFQGPERMLKLVGELAHSFRFRNKRPYLSAHSSIAKHKTVSASGSGGGSSAPETMMKRGPLTTIVLYQSPGEYLCGVSLSQAFPNYMVVGSAERGSRDVNIKSSLRYRNRTPDGRGLTDAEKETWSEVYKRFAEQERFDSDDGWELYLSASATGMKQRHAEVPMMSNTSSPSTHGLVRQSERVQRAGSFLPFPLQRMKLALNRFVEQQKSAGLPQQQRSFQGGNEQSRDDPITRLAAHASLPLFASGGYDGAACLWHVGEPRPVCKLPRPLSYSSKSPITRLRISPDGYRVVAGDGAGRCAIWQVDLGESQPFLNIACAPSNRAINDLAYLNLSSVFATCSADGVVNLWDTLLPPRSCCVASWYNPVPPSSTSIPVSNSPVQLGLSSLVFSPQTRCLFTGNERGSIYSIDVRQCRTAVEARQVHQKPITTLAISPDGYTLGSGSMDGSLKLFSLDDLSPIASVPNVHPYSFTHHQAVTEIVFAPNGSIFSCGADGTVKITYSSEAVM